MIDLNICRPGQKLRSSQGEILTYVGRLPKHSYYQHLVRYANGSEGSRMNDGFVYKNPEKRLPTDHDIVEILPWEPVFSEEQIQHLANVLTSQGHRDIYLTKFGRCGEYSSMDYEQVLALLDKVLAKEIV